MVQTERSLPRESTIWYITLTLHHLIDLPSWLIALAVNTEILIGTVRFQVKESMTISEVKVSSESGNNNANAK